MRLRTVFGLITLLAIGATLLIPTAMAATVEVDPQDMHTKTYDMNQGGIITWSWDVLGGEEIDFWIEDEDGAKYEQVDDDDWDAGSFWVHESGKYEMIWFNDNVFDPVTVEYSVTTTGLHVAEDIFAGLVMTLVLVAILIIVIIVIIVAAVVYGGKKTPAQPGYQQPYQQQQYYQQQPYQQPYQQYPQQQYPQPQQPQEPQQPQQPGQQYPPGQ